MNYTETEIIEIFFLIYKVRQKEFKNKSRISTNELDALADKISEIEEYLEFDEGKTLSGKTIKRLLGIEKQPVNVKKANINKVVKYITKDKFAELLNPRFIAEHYKAEFDYFQNNYQKDHAAFFEKNERFKIVDGSEVFYDFNLGTHTNKNDNSATKTDLI